MRIGTLGCDMGKTMVARLLAGSLIALTAGCGASDQTGNAGSGNAVSSAAAKAASWDAANACTLIDRTIVAEAAGVAVMDARLDGIISGEGLATHSTCTFMLANNGMISVLVRKSPTPDFSREAVEKARTMGGAMPAAIDVPGIGRAALWTKETNGLQVFVDDTRYLTISVFNPPAGKEPKAIATAVAAKLV